MTLRTHTATMRLDAADGDGLRPAERAHLRPPRQMPDGAWRVDAVLARGDEVKDYAWGPEQIPWEELRRTDTVDAFSGLPATPAHPEGDRVTVANARGSVRPDVRTLRADAIEEVKILRGTFLFDARPTAQGLSVGWDSVRLDTATEPPTQRDLVPNHVAIHPSLTPRVTGAGVRVDENDKRTKTMAKIQIGDVQYECEAPLAQAIASERAASKARVDSLDAEKTTLTAERDNLKGQVTALEASRVDADEMQKRVDARVALIAEAQPFVEGELPKTDHELRCAVVRADGLDPEGMGEEVVKGAYMVALRNLKARAGNVAQQREAFVQGAKPRVDAKSTNGFMGTHHFTFKPLGG